LLLLAASAGAQTADPNKPWPFAPRGTPSPAAPPRTAVTPGAATPAATPRPFGAPTPDQGPGEVPLAGKSLRESVSEVYGDKIKDWADFEKKFEKFGK